MFEIIRNMFRRKLRTFLTVFGITIGVFALTVMGAMAEKTNGMIDGGVKFFSGEITVTDKGGFMAGPGGGGLVSDSAIKEIERTKGVHSVMRTVALMLEDSTSMGSFGMPSTIQGVDLAVKSRNRSWSKLEMKSGRMLREGDTKVVALGSDIAAEKKAKVGETIKVRGEKFKVVGVIDKTITGPDKIVLMSIDDARRLLVESVPFLRDLEKQAKEAQELTSAELAAMPKATREKVEKAASFKSEQVATGASVYWRQGEDPEILTKRIKKRVEDVAVMSPKDMTDQFQQMALVFNLIVLGSALIAVVVGGLSVINTMIMSVSERTREIGIKKAVGAGTSTIVKEYLLEAGFIGLLGGAIGLGLGTLVANGFNSAFASKGVEVFLVTQRLAVGSLAFSFSLGVIAGIYPALHAARLDPVRALRTQ